MLTEHEIDNLDCVEKFMYEKILEQINDDPHMKWGENLNVIIISDRCFGRAHGIFDYLSQKTDISNIEIFQNFEEIRAYVNKSVPDIVIYVGYQKDERIYEIINLVREINPHQL